MSGAGGPELVVRVSANLSELKAALTEGVTQFETTRSALNQMSNAFDGTRTLQQAGAVVGAILQIGDVTKLTAAEQAKANTILADALAKYQALGREAPPGMKELELATRNVENATVNWSTALRTAGTVLAAVGIPASIGAMVALGKALFDDADLLVKLHDKTGISVEGLQALRISGDDAGVSLESMTSAVTMLQKRLGGDDEGANKALRDLGINIDAFRQMDGAQQLNAVSKAIQSIPDPLRVASDLSALFGRQWAEQLPALKRGFKELEDGSGQMSAGTVKALDDAGDAAARLYRSFKANLGEALADVLTLSLSDLRQLNAEIAKLPAVANASAMKNFWGALVPPSLPSDLDEINQKLDASAKAQIATTEAMQRLNDVGADWHGTLNTIDGAVAQYAESLMRAGANHKDVQVALGLTDAQMKALTIDIKAQDDALKKQTASIEQVTQLWDEFDQLASKGGTHFDDQVAAIDRWAADLTAKAQKAGTDTAAFYEALTALWNAKLHEASQNAQAAMDKTANHSIQSFDAMSTSVMGIATSFDGWNKAVMGVDTSVVKLAKDMATLSQGNTLDLSTAAQDPLINEFLHDGWSLKNAEALKLSRQYGFTPQLYDDKGNPESTPSKNERVPGYASGVMNAPGGWAMVGERGPELMRVPSGADIYPSGSGPAGTTIQIYVTQPLGTPAAIAAAVDQALIARHKNTGQRF